MITTKEIPLHYFNTYDPRMLATSRPGDASYAKDLPWQRLSGEQQEMYKRALPAWCPSKSV
mgnify:CR=1 FL=1